MGGRQGGGAILGLIIGLVIGLAVAVAVAVYITHAPLPFVNKVQKPSAKNNPAADAPLPDPNKALWGNSKAEPVAPPEKADATPDTPAPEAKPADIQVQGAEKPAGKEAPAEANRYQLQVGAFRAPDEADSMLARLALLGHQARIFPIEQGGQTLYRVRLGPYGHADEVARVRKLLSENGIDSQVVQIK